VSGPVLTSFLAQIQQQSKGGLTTMENGALVHKHCHPKGDKVTADFAEHWKKKQAGN
jgi:hypothetical protein